ncbi:MAG TPA: pseudouridine-5'-phosphate glycosidase [Gemmatimonadaceae bacterium]|nr:pseudouridine-5'-phosphate glycosidase [Gemmatimonadaceae bacterium]
MRVAPAIANALAGGLPVVALESSVLAQGLPIPANREACERMLGAVERNGAVPAITAVVRGTPTVGLSGDDLERFLRREGVIKVAARDMAGAATQGLDGATTVSASLVLAAAAGVRVFATGGIGGVHRDAPYDESADLLELSRVSVICVCAGAKAILDLRATAERLETLSVPVVGFGTDWLPEFYCEGASIPVSVRVDSADQVARLYDRHKALGMRGAVLVANPPPEDTRLDRASVERAVSAAIAELKASGVEGKEVTPALLASVERATGGRSLAANLALLESNAALAARIAMALSAAEKNR